MGNVHQLIAYTKINIITSRISRIGLLIGYLYSSNFGTAITVILVNYLIRPLVGKVYHFSFSFANNK